MRDFSHALRGPNAVFQRPWRRLQLFCAVIASWCAVAGASVGQEASAPVVERLGNPFLERWPHAAYPRNIWDMVVFDGALYLGAGNSANGGPSPNAGPAPIVRFRDEAFETVLVTDDEQVDVFRVIGERLVVPGHDARESWDYGNIYAMDESWRKIRVVPNGIHVYDVADVGERLVAVGGAQRQTTDAWVSRDGYDWRPARSARNRDLMPIENPSGEFEQAHNGRLYATLRIADTVFATGFALLRFRGAAERTMVLATAFSFDPDGDMRPESAFVLDGAGAVRRVGVDFFPGQEIARPFPLPHVRRAIAIGDTTYYLGVFSHNDHQWIPFGVFAARSADDIRRVPVAAGAQVYDLAAVDGALFALANTALESGGVQVSVLRLRDDGLTFPPTIQFAAPTFARSFQYYDGAWYFGLGSEVDEQGSAQGLAPETGEVWRVRWRSTEPQTNH